MATKARSFRRFLEATLVLAVLTAIAWSVTPRISESAVESHASTLASSVRHVRTLVGIHRNSTLIRTNDRGWPLAISPRWFPGERLPSHPWTSQPFRVEVVDGDAAMEFPADKTFDESNSDAPTLWYNRTNGRVCARVPAGADPVETLELFNSVNGCELVSLVETAPR